MARCCPLRLHFRWLDTSTFRSRTDLIGWPRLIGSNSPNLALRKKPRSHHGRTAHGGSEENHRLCRNPKLELIEREPSNGQICLRSDLAERAYHFLVKLSPRVPSCNLGGYCWRNYPRYIVIHRTQLVYFKGAFQ